MAETPLPLPQPRIGNDHVRAASGCGGDCARLCTLSGGADIVAHLLQHLGNSIAISISSSTRRTRSGFILRRLLDH